MFYLLCLLKSAAGAGGMPDGHTIELSYVLLSLLWYVLEFPVLYVLHLLLWYVVPLVAVFDPLTSQLMEAHLRWVFFATSIAW